MAEPDQSDISVDEIMRRIREEVERRKGASASSGPPLPRTGHVGRGILPGENDPSRVEIIPLGNLDSYISSRWFLDVAGQGIKGWVKAQIFKVIRFYAWWQEHINRAFYEALTRQQTKIAEVERGMQETFQQKVSELVGELTARDQMLEEINQRLTCLNPDAGKWGQDLQNLKGEWIESQTAFPANPNGKNGADRKRLPRTRSTSIGGESHPNRRKIRSPKERIV